MQRAWLAALASVLICPGLVRGQETKIVEVVGPIVGHVDTDRALIWLRATGVRRVKVTLGGEQRLLEVAQLGRGFGTVELKGLQPDTPYAVEVSVAGAKPTRLSFRTPPRPISSGSLRFGVGSCARFVAQPVWDQVLKHELDFFVFLGDNCYYGKREGGADWDRLEWMVEKQLKQRSYPNLLECMRNMATYAIWDDHDYGPNNSDSSWALRSEARLVHRYMWANPGCGEDEQGIYFSFRWGPVEFFLLDSRFFKDVRKALPKRDRQLYGEKQVAWLRRGLEASTAPLKIVGGGVQQLLGYPYAEGWDQAPAERKRFLEWLGKNGSRVLFLSGDVHVSELYHVGLPGGRKAWELTSSGLANGSRYSPMFKALKREERKWVVAQENFCVVDVDIPDDAQKGSLRFRCISAKDGSVLADTKASLATFGAAPPAPTRRRAFK